MPNILAISDFFSKGIIETNDVDNDTTNEQIEIDLLNCPTPTKLQFLLSSYVYILYAFVIHLCYLLIVVHDSIID